LLKIGEKGTIWENEQHFKEKMSQEQAHHHRKPWIRA